MGSELRVPGSRDSNSNEQPLSSRIAGTVKIGASTSTLPPHGACKPNQIPTKCPACVSGAESFDFLPSVNVKKTSVNTVIPSPIITRDIEHSIQKHTSLAMVQKPFGVFMTCTAVKGHRQSGLNIKNLSLAPTLLRGHESHMPCPKLPS